MLKKLLSTLILVLFIAGGALAQDMHIMWADYFEDDDLAALKDVGWLYYSESDGVVGAIVEQREGELFLQQGSYGGIIGVSILETNGTPLIDPENEDTTKALLVQNDYSDPNQVIAFKIRFARWRDLGDYTSFVTVVTRLEMSDPEEDIPDADPTEAPGYALSMWPLSGAIVVGKYDSTEFAVLTPGGDGWTVFGQGTFPFELEVDYRIKFSLIEGDVKVKIWEGEPEDEPAEWLIEGTDPDPRVAGKFTGFASVGVPPTADDGDQMYLDDVEVWGLGGDGVDAEQNHATPTDFKLSQNYPNPFNPTTGISFVLPETNNTKLVVYNTTGQVIRTLLNADLAAGAHSMSWDGLNESGTAVSSGIYFYQLTSGKQTISKRMLLMK